MARGHEKVLSLHKSTFEITKDTKDMLQHVATMNKHK